jgi:hypothetical protein
MHPNDSVLIHPPCMSNTLSSEVAAIQAHISYVAHQLPHDHSLARMGHNHEPRP